MRGHLLKINLRCLKGSHKMPLSQGQLMKVGQAGLTHFWVLPPTTVVSIRFSHTGHPAERSVDAPGGTTSDFPFRQSLRHATTSTRPRGVDFAEERTVSLLFVI